MISVGLEGLPASCLLREEEANTVR